MRKWSGWIAAAALLCVLLTGCGSMGNGYDAYDRLEDFEYSTAEDSADGSIDGQKLIRRLTVSIDTTNFAAALQLLRSETAALGGYVGNSTVEGTDSRMAELTLRIPADKLDAFSDKLDACGQITSRSESADDVQDAYIDLTARIKALQTEQETLLRLLGEAKGLNDVLTLQERLTETNSELERYLAKQRSYDSQIAYASVKIYLHETTYLMPEGDSVWQRMGQGFMSTLRDIGDFASEMLILLVSGAPVWAPVLVIVLVTVLISRRAGKRKKQRAAVPHMPPVPPKDDKH